MKNINNNNNLNSLLEVAHAKFATIQKQIRLEEPTKVAYDQSLLNEINN
jgi:hypothetical protein